MQKGEVMTIERAQQKLQALTEENFRLRERIEHLSTEYEVVTDQYMNGDICHNGSIGRYQNRLEREKHRCQRQVTNNVVKIQKLKKYCEQHESELNDLAQDNLELQEER